MKDMPTSFPIIRRKENVILLRKTCKKFVLGIVTPQGIIGFAIKKLYLLKLERWSLFFLMNASPSQKQKGKSRKLMINCRVLKIIPHITKITILAVKKDIIKKPIQKIK